MRTIAILLAGGTGTRVGADLPKQLLPLGGRPLIEHPLATLDAHHLVDEVVVMMAPGHLGVVRSLVEGGGYAKVSQVLEGAETRSGTTRRALEAIGEEEANLLFHDAARPLVSKRIITDCVQALGSYDAVATVIASSDTVFGVSDDGTVVDSPPRSRLRRAQTPQAFKASTIRAAYAAADADPGFEATDDCTVVLRYLPGVAIGTVEGDERNLKVTGPLDLQLAETLLR